MHQQVKTLGRVGSRNPHGRRKKKSVDASFLGWQTKKQRGYNYDWTDNLGALLLWPTSVSQALSIQLSTALKVVLQLGIKCSKHEPLEDIPSSSYNRKESYFCASTVLGPDPLLGTLHKAELFQFKIFQKRQHIKCVRNIETKGLCLFGIWRRQAPGM